MNKASDDPFAKENESTGTNTGAVDGTNGKGKKSKSPKNKVSISRLDTRIESLTKKAKEQLLQLWHTQKTAKSLLERLPAVKQ